jgi:glycosyltransferase involved in cell wall biosynthesis
VREVETQAGLNMLEVSVIVCTHNPRSAYLARVLDALRKQQIALESWELLVVDNGSRHPVAAQHRIEWHPHARVIEEAELGLTPARLRGIREALSELLVFVDDDNVLDSLYLREAIRINRQHPQLGVWGGQSFPEFEVKFDQAEVQPYLPHLCLREIRKDRWSNFAWETEPWGAGMCVRRVVAESYSQQLNADLRRKSLDRKGNSLVSAGDADIAACSYDLGLGTGLFQCLFLTHLIPAARLDPGYLSCLVENHAYSGMMLSYFRNGPPATDSRSLKRRWFDHAVNYLSERMTGRVYRRYLKDRRSGQKRALREMAKLKAAGFDRK